MTRTIILGGVAALALTGAAVAQQAERAPRAERGPVSQAEFVDRQVQRLRAMDADNDGVVTAAERTAARAAARAERADRRFARMDANGDGMISRAEFDAAAEARGDHRRGPRHGMRHGMRGDRAHGGDLVIAEAQARAAERFARMDADGDGVVTSEERRATMAQWRARRGEHRAPTATE